MAQLAQLNGMNGMKPLGVNMNMLSMANLSALGISTEAQLLAARLAAQIADPTDLLLLHLLLHLLRYRLVILHLYHRRRIYYQRRI